MTEQTKPTHQSTSAATDVEDFIGSLDAGIFERKLSIAVSQVAAAVVDNERKGEVTIKLSISKIPGTHQVHIAHELKFTRPTKDGKAIEQESRTTAMHVGKFGRLTLAPENQLSMFDRDSQPRTSN